MPTPTQIGILSIGDMGLGIAKLLTAHNFAVLTSLEGRSEATRRRAASANVRTLDTDVALVTESDVLLSIVPPRDALATANRIVAAAKTAQRKQPDPLYFLDLNATSPRSARETAETLEHSANVRFIDGGIIGGPPKPKEPSGEWYLPSVILSGPHELSSLPADGPRLASVLNVRHVSPKIGSASGLKMVFASMSKGPTAIAIQAFTTAYALGVQDELAWHLEQYNPKGSSAMMRGMTNMPPKAYRWVEEMRQIAATMREDGGFEGNGLFDEVAKVYDIVANDTALGEEKTEERKRGLTPEDVAAVMREGLVQVLEKGKGKERMGLE